MSLSNRQVKQIITKLLFAREKAFRVWWSIAGEKGQTKRQQNGEYLRTQEAIALLQDLFILFQFKTTFHKPVCLPRYAASQRSIKPCIIVKIIINP
jgi:hypothetical protein